jgi:hypothetical protein
MPTPTPFVVALCLDGPLRDITEPFYRAYDERFGTPPESPAHLVTSRRVDGPDGPALLVEATALDPVKEVSFELKHPLYNEAVVRQEAEAQATGTAQPMAPLRSVPLEEARVLPELKELSPFNLLEKFEFKDQPEIDEFVQGDGFFIFARAPQAESGLPTWLNELYYGVHRAGGRLVLLASDPPKLRPAALVFAAGLGAYFDEIRFVETPAAYWAGVDYLVTTSERLMLARPENSRALVCLRAYNTPADFIPNAAPITAGAPTAPVTYVSGIRQLLDYFPNESV